MLALDAAQVSRDAFIELGVDRAEIVLQEDVFGRDRRVGLKLENPMAVLMLQRQQRIDRPRDGSVEARREGRLTGHRHILLCRHSIHHGSARWHVSTGVGVCVVGAGSLSIAGARPRRWCTRVAAAKPERIAPSIVAGKPVST